MNTHRSTWNARNRRYFRFALWGCALLLCWGVATTTAHAQAFESRQPIEPRASVVAVPVVETATVAELTSMDLTGMSEAWWKETIKQHKRLLGSKNAALREQALQNVIFFATFYPGADARSATGKLFKIYRHDRNEAHRIMALAALHAIGDAYTMERLREHVADEESERVRRYTLLALADYYGYRKAP